MNLTQLSAPFDPRDIEWKPQTTGKKKDGTPWVRVLAYLTSRAVMDRLDVVCGPSNWRNEYQHDGKAVMCGLSVRVTHSDGATEWVTKWDGAEETDIHAVKGGLSGAMKRAAVQWGIGRYLYDLGESYGRVTPDGAHWVKADPKHGDAFKWDPPTLPTWALPPREPAKPAPPLTLADAMDMKLPGTKAHFHGHGGKRLGDIPPVAFNVVLVDVVQLDGKPEYAEIVKATRLVAAHLVTVAQEAQPA